jgi:hypothetical protein
MRSHGTAATDVLADRRLTPKPESITSLERELAQARAMCRRHETAIEALTHALDVFRRGAAALTDENRELRAQIAARRKRGRA